MHILGLHLRGLLVRSREILLVITAGLGLPARLARAGTTPAAPENGVKNLASPSHFVQILVSRGREVALEHHFRAIFTHHWLKLHLELQF